MLTNRSAPHAHVVPILMVANVRPVVAWCARVFGFVEHVQTGEGKHVQLGLPGGGELLVGELFAGEVRPRPRLTTDGLWTAIFLKVEDVAATLARAVDNYATSAFGVQDTDDGERHAMIDDVFGHRWILNQPAQMSTNPSAPRAHVVPAVWVANARAAVDWYTRVFGFVANVQAPEGAHAELSLPGGGELMVGEARPLPKVPSEGRSPEILLKVEDTKATLARAVENGAVVFELRDIEAGERQATIDDVFGHRWLLTQTLVDTAPEQWGGKTVTPRR
jgi:PhnB protein